MSTIRHPFYPIIYVRGYAMTQAEIDATTATPYMGFNLGATKIRQHWDGEVVKHYFESPLIRLMKDWGYQDAYAEGAERAGKVAAKTIFVHRYYDVADQDFGGGKAPSIVVAAEELCQLIAQVREQVCGDDVEARREFRVYLVAHSMGGLICRCLLQNELFARREERELVDKVFTYATPHNGIEMAGVNVPGFLGIWDMDNFNRRTMAGYLSLDHHETVADLGGKFDPQRFFCMVGTNHQDYSAALGMSRRMAGPMSDGLVKIENAVVAGAPRAFAYRSHSGPFGIVNSEEGYQNLVRFLFGDLRVDGLLEVEKLPLPPSVQSEKDAGRQVRASYFFEATVGVRAAAGWSLTERRKDTYSAVLRKYDELFKPDQEGLREPRWPFLFSAFLDSGQISHGQTLVFSIDLAVSATDYEIDGRLFSRRRVPGENLFRDTVTIRATAQSGGGWRVRYNLSDEIWAERRGRDAQVGDDGVRIPLTSRKGFAGHLLLRTR